MTGVLERGGGVPQNFVGPPITETRARELAFEVACALSQENGEESLTALMELLLGIAPSPREEGSMPIVRQKRLKAPQMQYDPSEVEHLLRDLWTRHVALVEAIAVLFTFRDEFAETVSRFAETLHQKDANQKPTIRKG